MLKDYAELIKLIVSIALGTALFVGGCSLGKKDGAADRTNLEGQVSSLQTANDGFVKIEEARKRQLALERQRSAEWKKAADEAEKRLADANKTKDKAEKKARDALAKASKDPDCAELLKREVCSVVPMP